MERIATKRAIWAVAGVVWMAGCSSDTSGTDGATADGVLAGDFASPIFSDAQGGDLAVASDASSTDLSTSDSSLASDGAIDAAMNPSDLAVLADLITLSDGNRGDLASADLATSAPENVVQRNNGPTRAGMYVQPLLNLTSAPNMHRDTTFDGTVSGHVYAQPLFVENGPGGHGAFIVATESNNVYALDAQSGTPLWMKNVGSPAQQTGAGCGNITPLGITGTPFIDLNSRTIYFDAVIGNSSTILRHEVHALSLDDGSERSNFPFNLSGVSFGGTTFNPVVQNQRGALLLQNGVLYIPFGGHYGDCGNYHGWVVGVPVANPSSAKGWATPALKGGIWAPGGVVSDGTNLFATSGNTSSASTWGGGEAVLRFQAGPVFSGMTTDYWAPTDWLTLDQNDTDINGSEPLLVDVSGATPSQLVVALGKDGNMYLNNRNNLGGVASALTVKPLASGELTNTPATFTNSNGVFVAVHGYMGASGKSCPAGQSGDLILTKIAAASPPTISTVWCMASHGQGEPIVTTVDGTAQPIIWSAAAEGTNRLYAWNAVSGMVLFNGGGAGDAMTNLRRFQSPIAVHGRIFVAGDGRLYAFTP